MFAIIPIAQQERENVQKGVGQVSFLQQCANVGEGWDKTLTISKKVPHFQGTSCESNFVQVIGILTDLIISCSTSSDDNPLTREGIPCEAQQGTKKKKKTKQKSLEVIIIPLRSFNSTKCN